jgi:putative addiction module component (TIGR02574 family)
MEARMSETATKLLTEALGLSPDERFQLVQQLLDSLEGDELLPVDPTFQAELNERLEQVSKGTAKLIPWEEARENLLDELQRRRAARDAESRT